MPLADDLMNAIREHRATMVPAAWSKADRKLYSVLPEVPEPEPDEAALRPAA